MWVDVGRRDVRLAGGIDTLDVTVQRQYGRCSVPGCQRSGEHDGMCGRHFWQTTRDLDSARASDRMAAAYMEVLRIVRSVPCGRSVSLRRIWQEVDQPRPVRNRIRCLLARAAGRPGIEVETGDAYWLRITDPDAAAESIYMTAMSLPSWEKVLSEWGLSRETC